MRTIERLIGRVVHAEAVEAVAALVLQHRQRLHRRRNHRQYRVLMSKVLLPPLRRQENNQDQNRACGAAQPEVSFVEVRTSRLETRKMAMTLRTTADQVV